MTTEETSEGSISRTASVHNSCRSENVQTLMLGKRGDPVYITTPLGVIKIDRAKEDTRKLTIHLPAIQGFRAFVGEKPEVQSLPLVSTDSDGHLTPNFDMLAPVLDTEGNMVGVCSPRVFRLEENRKDLSGVPAESTTGDAGPMEPVSEVRQVSGLDYLGRPVKQVC